MEVRRPAELVTCQTDSRQITGPRFSPIGHFHKISQKNKPDLGINQLPNQPIQLPVNPMVQNKKDSRPEWVVGIDPSPHKLCNLNHISKIVGSIYPNFVGHTYVQFEVCIPGTCYIKYHLVNCYIAIPVRIW